MTDEEMLILNLLKANPEVSYSRREIARRAVKRRVYEEDPEWVGRPLSSLIDQKLVERDNSGCYRYRRDEHLG